MTKPKLGRPRPKLKRATHTITRRVRRLIDMAHDGNVQAAGRATGLPYPTIRDLYLGRSTNPSLKTLKALADTYRVFEQWFSDEKQGEEIPMGGWVAYLPALDGSIDRRKRRQTVIPFAAWSMKSVAEKLDSALEASPPSLTRPIVGDSLDDELNLKLSTFLLRPILDAEQAIGREIAPNFMSTNWGNREMDEKWISRLRLLGLYWESTVDELIDVIQKEQ
jgi:transcriptional regulator with XRE-family HTH domain